jgi:HlyD family secretion protein
MAKRHWYSSKYLWLGLIIVVASGGFGAWQFFSNKTEKVNYLFGNVERGSVITQVQMTGSLAAVTTVAVGTQVSGTVSELFADYNSGVKKDQILAKLDPALYQTLLDQADASVKTCQEVLNNDTAAVATAKANIESAKVNVTNSTRKYKIMKELFDEGLETRDDMDSAQATLDSAVASLSAAQSQLEANQAALKADKSRLDQAVANLKNAQVNLDHCVITSPISGTVISRAVDRGQTVAASFATPTMFTIGEDLTKMQVITNTDEADVGKLKDGMEATFMVDAYAGETFRGTIRQVRLASTTVNNVVTYNAVIDVPNPDLRLKPGMTANVKIVIDRVDNVLKVGNAAQRFRPEMSDTNLAAAFQRSGEEQFLGFYRNQASQSQQNQQAQASVPPQRTGGIAMGFSGSNRGTAAVFGNSQQNSKTLTERGRRSVVWIEGEDKDTLLRPVVLRLGLTDGVQTEIIEGKLQEGDKVILSAEVGDKSTSSSQTRASGFGPPMGPR